MMKTNCDQSAKTRTYLTHFLNSERQKTRFWRLPQKPEERTFGDVLIRMTSALSALGTGSKAEKSTPVHTEEWVFSLRAMRPGARCWPGLPEAKVLLRSTWRAESWRPKRPRRLPGWDRGSRVQPVLQVDCTTRGWTSQGVRRGRAMPAKYPRMDSGLACIMCYK